MAKAAYKRQVKNVTITVRFTGADVEEITRRAQATGVTVREYLRAVALRPMELSEGAKTVIVEVGRLREVFERSLVLLCSDQSKGFEPKILREIRESVDSMNPEIFVQKAKGVKA